MQCCANVPATYRKWQTPQLWMGGGGGGGMRGVWILLSSAVTLSEYNVSTILLPIVAPSSYKKTDRPFLPSLQESKPWTRGKEQHAKNVVSDSLGLVDFAIGLVTSVDEWRFSRNSNHRRTVIKLSHQKLFSLVVEITSGLLHSSYSLPNWQGANFLPLYPEESNRWYVIFHQKVSSFLLWWEGNENIWMKHLAMSSAVNSSG